MLNDNRPVSYIVLSMNCHYIKHADRNMQLETAYITIINYNSTTTNTWWLTFNCLFHARSCPLIYCVLVWCYSLRFADLFLQINEYVYQRSDLLDCSTRFQLCHWLGLFLVLMDLTGWVWFYFLAEKLERILIGFGFSFGRRNCRECWLGLVWF